MRHERSRRIGIHRKDMVRVSLVLPAVLLFIGCALNRPMDETLRSKIHSLSMKPSAERTELVVSNPSKSGRFSRAGEDPMLAKVAQVRHLTLRVVADLAQYEGRELQPDNLGTPEGNAAVAMAADAFEDAFVRTLVRQSARAAPYPIQIAQQGSATSGDRMTFVVGLEYVRGRVQKNPLWIHFEMGVQVRLLQPGLEDPLFERSYEIGSEALPPETWLANDGERLRHVLQRALADLREWIRDDLLLTYRLSEPSDQQSRRNTFLLSPIEPELDRCFGCRGGNEPVEVDSPKPSFEWQAFPRPRDIKSDPKDVLQQIESVTYDLRVYRDFMPLDLEAEGLALAILVNPMLGAMVTTQHMVGGELIYERTGLAKPEHRMEASLDDCGVYMWTVRARFELDGQVRATPWSSTAPAGLSEVTASYSPAIGPGNPSFWYFRILAPCKAREKARERERQRRLCDPSDINYDVNLCER